MILFLDLETGGTDETLHPILQIGACWFDQPGTFFRRVAVSGDQCLQPDALRVNGETATTLADPARVPAWLAVGELLGWIKARCGDVPRRVTLAGWNVHFDHRFLRAFLRRMRVEEDALPFRHTLLDLHSLVLAEQMCRRASQPASEAALFGSDLVRGSDHAAQICNIPVEGKPHGALAGALWARSLAHALGLPHIFA